MTTTCFIRLIGGPYPVNAIPYEPDAEAIDWPPPERLVVMGVAGQPVGLCDTEKFEAEGDTPSLDEVVIYRKVRQSQLPDATADALTHVARGAEYELESDPMAAAREEEAGA